MSVKGYMVNCFACFTMFCGCSDIIDYSPYDSNVSAIDYNSNSTQKIDTIFGDTLKFVFFADTHGDYDELEEAISKINRDASIQFVLCGGDITNFGLAKEFEWYLRIIKNSKIPVVTTIGNHDYLSNGLNIFNSMFGKTNTSFLIRNYKFCLFDDVVWENKNTKPKFEWLQNELNDSMHYNIVVAHIPPWSDQMSGAYDSIFKSLVNINNTMLCLHSHTHVFTEHTYNEIPTIVSGSIDDKNYCVIKLTDCSVSLEYITF